MRFLITGSTGFIGRHLIEVLCKKGYYCRSLVRNAEKAQAESSEENVDYVVCDIRQRESLNGVAEGIDVVFHLAALLGDSRSSDVDIWETNVNGTRNLLDTLGGVQQFIYCSTPGVQGLGHRLAREDLPYNPKGMYERSKAEAEGDTMRFCQVKRVKWTILRPDFVYGPGDLRRAPLFRLLRDGKMYIIGSGQAHISPTYVTDVVNAFIQCVNNENAYDRVFNISGVPVTVEHFLRTIARNVDRPLPAIRIPTFLAYAGAAASEFVHGRILGKESLITVSKVRFLTQDHSTDSGRAHRFLNFHQSYSLDQGIEHTVAWYKEKGLLKTSQEL